MFKKILKFILSPFLGKRLFQGFFSLMHLFGLKGMNYGSGADFRNSGEAWVLKYARAHCKSQNPFILFDVGANVGGYALAAKEILADCKIYAFEPVPKIFAKLQEAIKSTSGVDAYNIGFSSKAGQAKINFREEAAGLTSLYEREVLKHPNTVSISVELDIIDGFCRRKGIAKINFLKLDVEGHELEVLKGAKGMLENRNIDFIQFELGGTDVDARVFLKDFFELLGDSYRISRILQDGLAVIDYDETKEIFITTNYLAEYKK